MIRVLPGIGAVSTEGPLNGRAGKADTASSGRRRLVGALRLKASRSDTSTVRYSVLAFATIAAGLGAAAAGALDAVDRPLTALALFGAAALAAELLEEPESARVREPLGPESSALPPASTSPR